MRIAYVVHKFPPEGIGGTEVYAWSLAHAVARAGHDVWVFYPSNAPGRRRDGDITLVRVANTAPRPNLGPISAFWRTFRNHQIERAYRAFLHDVRPDLVHFQHVQGVSARLPAMTDAPKVATLHDYWYLCANSQFLLPNHAICPGHSVAQQCATCGLVRAGLPENSILSWLAAPAFSYRNHVVRQALGQYDLLISPSYFLRDRYVDNRVTPERFAVLENGLDHARLSGEASGAMRRTSPDDPLHLVFLGSIAWQKGVHVLIEALNRLPTTITATIYGDLGTFPEYAQTIENMIHREGITLAGPLDHASIGEALRRADYLVVPSLWYENSPVVIQEAYACGVPVIASNMGALREKVQEGVTGRLFAPGDAKALANILSELAATPDLHNRYATSIQPGPTVEEHSALVLDHYRRLIVKS